MPTAEDLFAAIEREDVRSVRSILETDPVLAVARDGDGVSALMRAIYRLNPELMHALRAVVPHPDAPEAAALGDHERLSALVRGPIEASAFTPDGFSLLHLAAFFGHVGAAELLLDRGAEVGAVGRGWMTGTPLHSAASGRHADVVALLLRRGADPNVRQTGGWTPLHSAAHNGDLVCVALLLAAGADPAAVSDDATSVLDLAAQGGDAATIERIGSALGVQAP